MRESCARASAVAQIATVLCSRRSKSGSIGRWRCSDDALEGNTEGLQGLVATLLSDNAQGKVGRLQQLPCAEHALPLQPCDGTETRALMEPSQESPLAHGGVLRQCTDLDRLGKSRARPVHDLADGLPRPFLHRRGNILGLSAVTMRRHD